MCYLVLSLILALLGGNNFHHLLCWLEEARSLDVISPVFIVLYWSIGLVLVVDYIFGQ